MFSIQFNNYNSRDLGLVIEHKPNIPIAERNINNIYVPRRSGSLTEDLGTYRDIEISINFGFKDNKINKTRLIKQWFNDITDNKLIFSDDTDAFYKVKYVKCDGFERGLRILGRFNLIFVCEPFSYLFSGLETIEINNNNSTIYNEGTFESEPYLKIFGEGDFLLCMNNKTVQIKGCEQCVEIDSEMMECYKNTQNCNNKMIGEFPILQVGENNISWVGNVSKIEILPRWRCL